MQADLALKRQLQKSFSVVTREFSIFTESVKLVEPCLRSIESLSEQFLSCKKATIPLELSANFPSIREKLLVKLSFALDSYVDELRQMLETLEKSQAHIVRTSQSCMDLYGRYSDQVNISDIVRTSDVSWPPVAQMMEWLEDVKQLFEYQYVARKHCLDQLDYSDMVCVQQCCSTWRFDAHFAATISEILAKVTYFMAETF